MCNLEWVYGYYDGFHTKKSHIIRHNDNELHLNIILILDFANSYSDIIGEVISCDNDNILKLVEDDIFNTPRMGNYDLFEKYADNNFKTISETFNKFLDETFLCCNHKYYELYYNKIIKKLGAIEHK